MAVFYVEEQYAKGRDKPCVLDHKAIAVVSNSFVDPANFHVHLKVGGIIFFLQEQYDFFEITEHEVTVEEYLEWLNTLPGAPWQKVLLVKSERGVSTWVRELSIRCSLYGVSLIPVTGADSPRSIIDFYYKTIKANGILDRRVAILNTLPGISNYSAKEIIDTGRISEFLNKDFLEIATNNQTMKDILNWIYK